MPETGGVGQWQRERVQGTRMPHRHVRGMWSSATPAYRNGTGNAPIDGRSPASIIPDDSGLQHDGGGRVHRFASIFGYDHPATAAAVSVVMQLMLLLMVMMVMMMAQKSRCRWPVCGSTATHICRRLDADRFFVDVPVDDRYDVHFVFLRHQVQKLQLVVR